jgi:hypothetical protein
VGFETKTVSSKLINVGVEVVKWSSWLWQTMQWQHQTFESGENSPTFVFPFLGQADMKNKFRIFF